MIFGQNTIVPNNIPSSFTILKLLRPKQWTKNLLLFAGLIFSFSFLEVNLIAASVIGFIAFCFLSSATYIINDLADVNEDRLHPRKKHRPIAAGLIKPEHAVLLFIITLMLGFLTAWFVNPLFFISVVSYFLLTLCYTFWLKNFVIIDVFAIAFGFLIRALAGVVAINVNISSWFLLCAFLLSLFLALTKRRQEYIKIIENENSHRQVLEQYSVPYLDQLISIVTASTIIGYSLYTFSAGQTDLFMVTIPFVIYGIFRYLFLVYKIDLGESPEEVLLRDIPLIVNIVLWVIISAMIIAFEQGKFL